MDTPHRELAIATAPVLTGMSDLVAELRAALDGTGPGERLRLALPRDGAADVAGLQALVSALVTARGAGRDVTLSLHPGSEAAGLWTALGLDDPADGTLPVTATHPQEGGST